MHVELPGVKKEDIIVHVDSDILTVEADRKESVEKDTERYHYSERRFGTVKRQIQLPKSASVKNVKAKFDNGLLELEFEKIREQQEKRQVIEIK